jgi:cytochrome o ubiquinol oxidase subunit I
MTPTGDPWDARSLEWSTPSPPPPFNFAVLPTVSSTEPYWDLKQRARAAGEHISAEPQYTAIEMPRNSATGFITAFFAVVTGFALIWHVWWLVALGLVGAYATFVALAWRDVHEIEIPADEVARMDRANRAARSAALSETSAR